MTNRPFHYHPLITEASRHPGPWYTAQLDPLTGLFEVATCDQFDPTKLFVTRCRDRAILLATGLNQSLLRGGLHVV